MSHIQGLQVCHYRLNICYLKKYLGSEWARRGRRGKERGRERGGGEGEREKTEEKREEDKGNINNELEYLGGETYCTL